MKKTNNQIVEFIYKNYSIKGLINNMIDYSVKDGSNEDLEQYIYEFLLCMDNKRLNILYKSNH